MIEFEAEASEIIQRTGNVKSFRFKLEKPVAFKPGQFFFVTIKAGGSERTKHFTFSNSPTEKGYIEFTKRITSSDFSAALDKLKPGDRARLKMPYGKFTFEGEYDKIAFLSGGIGITPMRGICKYIVDSNFSTDVVLLYGNNKEEDIIFRDDFDKFQASGKNIRVVHTLTSPDIDKRSWRGRTGYIDENMLKEEIPDYKDRIFFVSGPPKMVETLTGILKEKLALPQKNIRTENFTGY